tara:strand:- start:3159 stop:4760 length:1602 start_codon:yes stop_codon:yes gene_type:complete
MPDTLKEFSNLSNKSYSHLKPGTGVQLMTTSASQQAVIKGISVDNPKSRAIDIRVGSATGTIVASATKTETLSGNEIIDNSSSLYATTSTVPTLTSWVLHTPTFEHDGGNITNIGADGRSDWGAVGTANSDLLGKLKQYDLADPLFEGETYTGTTQFWKGTETELQYANAQSNHASTQGFMGEVYKGADGKWYGWSSIDNDNTKGTIYRWDSDGTNRTTLANTSGDKQNIWDGSRYIYSFRNSTHTSHYLYDTNNGGSSSTFGTRQFDGSDGGTNSHRHLGGQPQRHAWMYCDGFAVVSGRSGSVGSSSEEQWPKLLDLRGVVAGNGANVMDFNYNHTYSNYNFASGSYIRNSVAIVKGTTGHYYGVFCWRNNDSHSSNDNGMTIYDFGKDVASYMSAGRNPTYTRRIKVNDIASNADDRYHILYKLSGRGNSFHCNQWANTTAIADGWLYGFADRFNEGQSGYGSVNGLYKAVRINIQSIVENGLSQDTQFEYFGSSADELRSGCWRASLVDSAVDPGFGNINLRTTGILVT